LGQHTENFEHPRVLADDVLEGVLLPQGFMVPAATGSPKDRAIFQHLVWVGRESQVGDSIDY
jgi:hypothetical protein